MRNIPNSFRKQRPTWRLHTKYFSFSQIVFTIDWEKRKYECKYLHRDGTFFHRTCVVLVQALEKKLQKPNLANHGDKLQVIACWLYGTRKGQLPVSYTCISEVRLWKTLYLFLVFMWRHHFSKPKNINLCKVLVLSDVRPSKKLTFCNVWGRQGSSLCNRVGLCVALH